MEEKRSNDLSRWRESSEHIFHVHRVWAARARTRAKINRVTLELFIKKQKACTRCNQVYRISQVKGTFRFSFEQPIAKYLNLTNV